MAHKKAAIKALRKAKKNFERNTIIRKTIKDLRKKAQRALTEKKFDSAKDLYLKLQKAVDKAAKKGGLIKPNTAARYKSQLAKKINALTKKK